MNRWLSGGLYLTDAANARVALVRLWLRAFGPGTERDIHWWTGLTLTETRRALAASGAINVELDEGDGHALPDDLDATANPGPWVALLPALDSATMGWADRGWYLGEHRSRLFDTNGNAGPTVWADGRVIGGWGQDSAGNVAYRLFEDVGGEAKVAVDAEADRVTNWLAGARITPRFRTPLEKELAA
jgi:hypothetical protein